MTAAKLIARLVTDARDPLFRSAYSLMATTVLTATLGVGFWIVAARLYPIEQVGRESALIAAMVTLSVLSQLNMGNAILRFVPTLAGGTRRAVLWAYGLAATASLFAGTAFVLIAPHVVGDFAVLREESHVGVAFVLGTTLWSIFVLQDAALTALRHPEWVPAENALYAVLKAAALPVFASVVAGGGVFLSWVVPMALLIAPVNYIVFARGLPRHVAAQRERGTPALGLARRALASFLAQDYLAYMLNVAAMNLLPLLVVALLGARENAYFYIPFMIATTLDLLLINVTASLTVEGSFSEDRLAELARRIVRRFGVALLVAVPAMVLLAPLLLLLFGESYRSEGTTVLQILIVATVFRAVLALFTAISRVRRRATPLVAMHAVLIVMLVLLTVLLHERLGAEAVAIAWLAANGTVALAVLPGLLRALGPTVERAA